MAKRTIPGDGEIVGYYAEKERKVNDQNSLQITYIAPKPAFNNAEYTVGWICALSIEYVAAQAFLDNTHEKPDHLSLNDKNHYTLGQMGKHNVVIAVLPFGSYGTTSAATAASEMMHSFPNVRIGLMVGIGGGAPSRKDDIRLGDIVVSCPQGDKSSVIQYDFGKNIQGQPFQQTGVLNKPPLILRAAVSGLEAKYEIDGHHFEESIDDALQKKPRLRKKYRRPDAASDRLYKSDFLHLATDDLDCLEMCGTKAARLVSRPARDENEDQILIHYGTIASGNKLIKNAEFRDALSESHGILCVEMEAAGLMDPFPCIVIRGICDYSDTHKNKEWQRYAAMVAAAYARDLLSEIVPSRVESEARMADIMSGIMKVAEERLDTTKKQLEVAEKQLQIQENTAKYQLSNDEQRCHQTFRLVVGARDATYEWYKDRVKERVEDTCLWFHRHEHFQKWLKQDSGPLLVSADPGCGKSVLAKYLIDHVLPRSATICYFFFKDQDQNTIRQALCAILHQLFSQRPSLIKYAMPRFREDGEKLIHSTKSLWRVFHDATSDPDAGPAIIVLDALDECAESDFGDLVQRVTRQFDRAGEDFHRGSLRYLMTCRPYEQIVSEFNGLLHAFSDIRVPGEEESEAIRKEVDRVITYRVALLKESKKLSGPVATHLEKALKAHGHRTYLWIYLVFDHLKRQNLIKTEKAINKIVNTLPENVSQAYEKILNRCDGTERRLVRNALGITLAAARPLKLAELNIALNINMKTNSFDDLDLEEDCDFQARLRSACGLFLSVHHDRVYFLHQTAREFLLQHSTEVVTTTTTTATTPRATYTSKSWHQSFTMPSAHDILARACVCLLNLPGYHIGILCSSETEAESSHENYGYSSLGADAESFLESRIGQFFSYAAIHWVTHFREANVAADATIMSAAVSICDVNTQLFKGWSELSRSYNAGCTVPSQAAASLAVASFHGHVGMVKRLLADGVDVNVRTKSGSPLHLAARAGYEEVVRLLLAHRADANATLQFDHQTPLLDAVCGGNVGIARLLLDHGATVNINAASRTHGPTVLPIAVTNGHAPLTALLLERGANTEAQDGYGCTVLQIAIANEDAVLVALLLDKGADTEARDLRGWTTLMVAAADGSANLVELLLERGANRSAKNSEGQTPRALALEEGHGAVAQML